MAGVVGPMNPAEAPAMPPEVRLLTTRVLTSAQGEILDVIIYELLSLVCKLVKQDISQPTIDDAVKTACACVVNQYESQEAQQQGTADMVPEVESAGAPAELPQPTPQDALEMDPIEADRAKLRAMGITFDLPPAISMHDISPVKLVITHDCKRAPGASNPKRPCNHYHVKQQYLENETLKAECGAPLRVEVHGGDPPRDSQIEVLVLNGQMYDNRTSGQDLMGFVATYDGKIPLKIKRVMGMEEPRIFVRLENREANLSVVAPCKSSFVVLKGQEGKEFRLFVRLVDMYGHPIASGNMTEPIYTVSEGFQVATQRNKSNQKPDRPRDDAPVTKVQHVGDQMAKKLKELAIRYDQKGLNPYILRQHKLESVTTAGQFKRLVAILEAVDGGLDNLRCALEVRIPEHWMEMLSHARLVGTEGSMVPGAPQPDVLPPAPRSMGNYPVRPELGDPQDGMYGVDRKPPVPTPRQMGLSGAGASAPAAVPMPVRVANPIPPAGKTAPASLGGNAPTAQMQYGNLQGSMITTMPQFTMEGGHFLTASGSSSGMQQPVLVNMPMQQPMMVLQLPMGAGGPVMMQGGTGQGQTLIMVQDANGTMSPMLIPAEMAGIAGQQQQQQQLLYMPQNMSLQQQGLVMTAGVGSGAGGEQVEGNEWRGQNPNAQRAVNAPSPRGNMGLPMSEMGASGNAPRFITAPQISSKPGMTTSTMPTAPATEQSLGTRSASEAGMGEGGSSPPMKQPRLSGPSDEGAQMLAQGGGSRGGGGDGSGLPPEGAGGGLQRPSQGMGTAMLANAMMQQRLAPKQVMPGASRAPLQGQGPTLPPQQQAAQQQQVTGGNDKLMALALASEKSRDMEDAGEVTQ